MNMVVHQHVGMKVAACVQQSFMQELQVTAPVVVIKKAGEAVVAWLDDMLRNI
jgi:hypothetical protein